MTRTQPPWRSFRHRRNQNPSCRPRWPTPSASWSGSPASATPSSATSTYGISSSGSPPARLRGRRPPRPKGLSGNARAAKPSLETKEKESATTGDVVIQRFAQDLANAKADLWTIFGTYGPPGITALDEYLVVLGTRTVGTVSRLGVDYVTLETGPGLRERLVAFPHPGVWIVRVAAVPSYEDTSEVTRPPSMAYLAVFATSQVQAAQDRLAATEAETARRTAEREAMLADVAERLERLGHPADPTQELESTSSIEQEILEGVQHDLEVSADTWLSREVARENLEQILTEIDTAIERTLGEPDDDQRNERLALLKSQRSAVTQQVIRVSTTLEVRESRIAGDPRLATATPLPVAFATDDGKVVQLARVCRGACGSRRVGDDLRPHPHQGRDGDRGRNHARRRRRRGVAQTPREQRGIRRGVAAVKLPGTDAAQSIRIEESPSGLAAEALESITTIVTIRAIVAAPFTGGASLAILVPIGVVEAGIAGYRLMHRYQLSTLDWDLETASDLLDVVGGLLGFAGAAAVALKAAKFTNAAKLGGLIVAGVDLGSNVAGLVVLGVQLQQELIEINEDHSLTSSQQRARSLIALGRAMMQIGMMAGQSIVNQGLALLAASAPAEALPRTGSPKTGTPEAVVETGLRLTLETGTPETTLETGTTGTPEAVVEIGTPETTLETGTTGTPEAVVETGTPETTLETGTTGTPEAVVETGTPETTLETGTTGTRQRRWWRPGTPETTLETGTTGTPEAVVETGTPETTSETGTTGTPEAVVETGTPETVTEPAAPPLPAPRPPEPSPPAPKPPESPRSAETQQQETPQPDAEPKMPGEELKASEVGDQPKAPTAEEQPEAPAPAEEVTPVEGAAPPPSPEVAATLAEIDRLSVDLESWRLLELQLFGSQRCRTPRQGRSLSSKQSTKVPPMMP